MMLRPYRLTTPSAVVAEVATRARGADGRESGSDTTDGALAGIRLLQAGDTKGMPLLFHHLGPALYGVALKMLGTKEDAEEALQDRFGQDIGNTFGSGHG
jgi:hypothetical protein